MELNFNQVTYEGELSDFSEEELRELVQEFETAQESNVAEFKTAAEATENIDESTISDFENAREELVEQIVGAEAFDEVPLTEDSLEDCEFSELRDWLDFVTAQESGNEEETEETEAEETDFEDFGTKSPTSEDNEGEDFADDALDEIQGLSL